MSRSAAACGSGNIRRADTRPKLSSDADFCGGTGVSVTDAIDPVASLLAVLDLRDAGARTTEDIFTGVSQPMPFGRVYGGQVLA